jgi:hypothetical protein
LKDDAIPDIPVVVNDDSPALFKMKYFLHLFDGIKTGYIGNNEKKAELMCCPFFQVMGQLVHTRE